MVSSIRYSLLFLVLLALLPAAHAQMGLNAPAGLAPVRDMEIYSRDAFVVQQKYIPTIDPISGTFTINCAASPPALTASAGVLLDPGGTSNYPASLTCAQAISTPGNPSSVGYELTFTQFGTETDGDSVVITDIFGIRVAFSGSALPPVLLVPGYGVTITFKADNDGNVGAGFALSWRRVSVVPSPTGGGDGFFGKSLQFDLTNGALVGGFNGVGALQRAGDYSTALGLLNRASGDGATALGGVNMASGNNSSALGQENTASGFAATALGYLNRAIGSNATALGRENTVSGFAATALGDGNTVSGMNASALGLDNTVSGENATALGYSNTASGFNSTALSYSNTASGNYSSALGFLNTASGHNSTAIGNRVSTAGRSGAMILGDNSTLTSTSATVNNQLTARFEGGYRFFSNFGLSTGVSLASGGTSWATISDSVRKERFLPIDGPDLLRKIGEMKLTTWNYKGQRDRRHYGPMAQEFFALFGHDALGAVGCDTLITTQDIEGLTLSAVQALVRENEQLKTRLSAVENENVQIRADFSNRLHLLERAMLTRRERVSLRKTNR